MTKLALITGASRGLGAALAEALAPTHHVIAVARTTGALEELDDRIQAAGGSARHWPQWTLPTRMPWPPCVAESMTAGASWICGCIRQSMPRPWPRRIIWMRKDWEKSVAINATAPGAADPYVAPLLGANGPSGVL